MNRLKGLSVQNKLTLGLGVVVGVLVALVLVAYQGLTRNAESERRLFEENFGNAYDLANLRSHLNAERLDVFVMAETVPETWGPWQKDLDERQSAIREILHRLETRFRNDPTSLARLRELTAVSEDFLKIRETEVLPELRTGRVAEVKELLLGIQLKQHLKIRALARDLEAGEAAEAEGMARDTAKRTQALLRMFAVAGTLAVLGALVLGIFLHRAMAGYVAERQRAEQELLRANRALRTISLCNQILVRAASEAALLRDICETIVREGGYLMAWIGFAENDPDKTVRPVAYAGAVAGYLTRARITWADTAQGRGPTGNAIRTGHPSVCRDMRHDPDFAPWRDEALKRGYASSAVLPLLAEGRVFGALSIYAAEAGAFDAAELKLLSELAEDLAYGIQVHRIRAERQQAQEALRRAGAYNRSLIEASLDPLVTIGPDGRIADVNAATETATGRSRGELIGTDFSDYFTEPEKARAGYRQVFRDGLVRDYPLELRHRDGHLTSVLYNASVYRDEAGSVAGVFAAARDVTERKRAELALAASEQEFRSLAESMPQIVWATRADGWNIYFNQRWIDYTGMTLEESYGHGWNKPFHPDDQQRAWKAWQEATRHGATYSLEVRLRRKDGEYRWWLVRGVPLLDAAGKILKWFGTCTDIEELKQAEALLEQRVAERTASLRESEARFRQVAESLPQLVWTCAPDGPCDYLSPQWVRYTGKSEAEQLGYGWLDQLHPDDRRRTVDQWQTTAARGENFVAEFRIRREDGAYRWFRTLAVPLRDQSGKLIKWFGSNTDIDDMKRAEEAVRRSEDRLRSVLRATGTGTFEIDLATGEGRWNDVEFELLGLKPGEVPSHPESFFRYVHPEDIGALAGQWEEAKRTGSLDAEFRVVRADGQVRWLAGKGHFAQGQTTGGNGGGTVAPSGFLGVNFDITERKQAEDRLRANEQLFRAVAANTPDHLLVQDRNLRYRLVVNPQLNLTEQEMLGKTDADFLDQADAEKLTAMKRHVIETGEAFPVETSLRARDGSTKIFSGAYVPKRNARGEVDGLIGYFRDVTERKRAELELQKLAAELQAANKELETFAYSVSHDLRAPLRSIDGFSRILLEDSGEKLDAEGRDNLRRVRSATQRMGELIDDLLKLSRAVRTEMWCVPLDLSALTRETLANLQQTEPTRQVECVVTPGLWATADRSLLRVAQENLLGNAWKFTAKRTGARIEFGAVERNGERAFFVRDNGAGFDPAYADKLFAPFQRLHGQEEFPGHGIGLATVQRIIHRHGGRVWAEGQVNEGATFYFTLPGKTNSP